VNLAPGFSDSGTTTVTVRASDNGSPVLTNDKSFMVTVVDVPPTNNPPVLAQPANMTVNEGATSDQILTATDPDGNPITFSKVSGPTFMTVVGNNVHLAPGFSDAGTYTGTVRASDGSLSDDKSFTITVINVNRPPVLAQPVNMTVNGGSNADQAITATDPDGQALTFAKVTGPTFMTVTTTSAGTGTGTGNIHLAPGCSDAGTYSASVSASDGAAADTKSLTITVNSCANQPPTLAQPVNMSVCEGATANQVLNATDPDGNPLTFTKFSGPLFMTVTTTTPGTGTATGNVNLAPGFADGNGNPSTYAASVRVSDGNGGTDTKSFNITVCNVNRAPTSNPGGPYSGIIGVPVCVDGTGSSDPDGDALTYAWTFGDGGTGTGPTPCHAYDSTGVFTVCLTVTDNGTPVMSDTKCTTATIGSELPARIFEGSPGFVIKPNSGKPRYCYQVEPVNGSYNNTDVILESVVMKYGTRQISAEAGKTRIDSDRNQNGIQEITVCFTKANIQFLFAGLPDGDNPVTVAIEGNLTTGGRFRGTFDTFVRGPVGGSALTASVSPNPLNPSAKLLFATSKPGTAKVEMFDAQGRLVRTILSPTFMAAGAHELTIDGRGQRGEKLASGIYFVRGVTADGTFKNTVSILK
jgi:PKD repeat protein